MPVVSVDEVLVPSPGGELLSVAFEERMMADTSDKVKDTIDDTAKAAKNATDTVAEKATEAGHATKKAAENLAEKAGNAVHKAGDAVERAGEKIKDMGK